jgi:hypothetical protein
LDKRKRPVSEEAGLYLLEMVTEKVGVVKVQLRVAGEFLSTRGVSRVVGSEHLQG